MTDSYALKKKHSVFFHALVLSNSPSYISRPLLLNCRRRREGRERERHTPAGEEGWCPLLPVLLGLQSVSKGEPRRTATAQQGSRRNRDNTSVCHFLILLQLHRSVTCSDSLLSSQVSNCLPHSTLILLLFFYLRFSFGCSFWCFCCYVVSFV